MKYNVKFIKFFKKEEKKVSLALTLVYLLSCTPKDFSFLDS